jgi:formylglycine-generating enzyme required for sulfatase activity
VRRSAGRYNPVVRSLLALCVAAFALQEPPGDSPGVYPPAPEGAPPELAIEGAQANDAEAMQAYRERIAGTDVGFDMRPIPGGTFRMGAPRGERGARASERPAREVQVAPHWMGRCEVSWDEFRLFQLRIDQQQRAAGETERVAQDDWADAVSRPTPPHVPMDFGMGVEGYPAICMTQFAAKQYTKWLSMKTGRFYRLPTEAEWEFACRAGTTTAYSFGDDDERIGEYAWYYENSNETTHPVGTKLPNDFGLHDMHGNVAEWVLDGYDQDGYGRAATTPLVDPIRWPDAEFPRVVRGGSWDDEAPRLRSAARGASRRDWKMQDPQLPKSIWYHTDARFVGFRVVRPLIVPSPEEQARYWDADLPAIREVEQLQRAGGR